MIKVRFLDFWEGFEPSKSLFTHLLKELSNQDIEIVSDPKRLVDLQFESVFPSTGLGPRIYERFNVGLNPINSRAYLEKYTYKYVFDRKEPALNRIWYTGENLRAPHDIFDLTLSFDRTDLMTNNLYFPIWKYRLDWGFEIGETEIQPKPEELAKARDVGVKSILNMCAFSRTTEPSRQRLFAAIERCLKVDKYGAAFDRPVESKLKTSLNYSLQLCPENALRPGYVTEKLQEAWVAANLPVWEGLHVDEIFNTDAFIDLTNLTTEEISQRVATLTLDEVNWKIRQPLLKIIPDLSDIKIAFNAILEG
jgi:Glycosyltransferase family 10 (fucosyltransferase) C-term